MKCGRCRKNFDEEMYSGICPKCGYFNNRQTEYDVSKYISAKFDGDDKVSTNTQAAKQHAELHRMYDSQNMHRTGAGSHEKLHEMYDKYQMHQQGANTAAPGPRPLSGTPSPQAYQPNVGMGKTNPYQTNQPGMQGRTYQTGQTGNTHQTGQTGNYGQSRYGQVNVYSEEKKKNIVTPICIVIGILSIVCTAALCYLKGQSLETTYSTLDFEQETVEPGELFEIKAQLLIVGEAETVDTSAQEGMPEKEKLVAVSVELLPADGGSNGAGNVYVSDGSSYKLPLNDYTVKDILYDGDYSMGDDILSQYDFNGNTSTEGKTGKLYFLVDENAKEICVSFEEGNQKDGLYVLHRRVSVPLQLEEDGI